MGRPLPDGLSPGELPVSTVTAMAAGLTLNYSGWQLAPALTVSQSWPGPARDSARRAADSDPDLLNLKLDLDASSPVTRSREDKKQLEGPKT